MPIEVRPIDPRDRRRKKLGRRGPPKPTKMGTIEERPKMTIGQRERLKALSKEREKNTNPDGSDMTIQQRSRNIRLKNLGMLSGGQAKIAAKAPPTNKIDAKDFAVLRAEKAKGRGKGLQDEKMKPGKMMKAKRGTIIKPKGPGVIRPKPQDRYGQPLKPKPIKPAKKMGGGMMKKPMGYDKGGVEKRVKAYALAQAKKDKDRLTERDISTAKKIVSKKMGGGLMEATQRLKAQGKMGGGMMMRPNPVGMKSGKSVKVKCKLGRNKPTKMY